MIFGWPTFEAICDTSIFYKLLEVKLKSRWAITGSWEPLVGYRKYNVHGVMYYHVYKLTIVQAICGNHAPAKILSLCVTYTQMFFVNAREHIYWILELFRQCSMFLFFILFISVVHKTCVFVLFSGVYCHYTLRFTSVMLHNCIGSIIGILCM